MVQQITEVISFYWLIIAGKFWVVVVRLWRMSCLDGILKVTELRFLRVGKFLFIYLFIIYICSICIFAHSWSIFPLLLNDKRQSSFKTKTSFDTGRTFYWSVAFIQGIAVLCLGWKYGVHHFVSRGVIVNPNLLLLKKSICGTFALFLELESLKTWVWPKSLILSNHQQILVQ